MAWYSGAERMELLPEAREQAVIRPTQLILHSIIAPWTARRTYEYWRDSTALESHLGIGYGDIAQYMPTDRQADANYRANRRPDGTGAISVETASNLQGTDPWNAYQVEELIKLGVWAHREHGIPLRICRSDADPGFGYHSLHAAWSPSGTACPGAARIRQFRELVFPGIVARATQTTNPSEEDDMPTAQEIAVAVWNHQVTNADTGQPVHTGAVIGWMDKVHNTQTETVLRQLAATQAAVTALATQLGQVHGVDTAAIVAAVQAAVTDALAAKVIRVHVDVTAPPAPTN